MSHPPARSRDYATAVSGALGISISPVFVTLAQAGPTPVAFWRFAYALPLLVLWSALDPGARACFARRGWKKLAAVSGVFFAFDLLSWHRSIALVGAGPATLLVSSQVIWVALFGALFLRERPSRQFWAVLPLVAAGMLLLCGAGPSGFEREADRDGLVFGLLSGLFYAGMLITSRRSQRAAPIVPQVTLVLQVAVALVVVLAAGLAEATLPAALSGRQHLWLLCLGVGTQVISWFLITAGIRRLPGHHGSLLLLAQPVGSLLLGWSILGQSLAPARAAGAVLVLAAVALTLRSEKGRELEPGSLS